MLYISGYFVLIFIVGFYVSTALYSAILPLITSGFTKKNAVNSLLTTAVILILVYAFSRFFYVEFPSGLLF
jgi:hypothetical protein